MRVKMEKYYFKLQVNLQYYVQTCMWDDYTGRSIQLVFYDVRFGKTLRLRETSDSPVLLKLLEALMGGQHCFRDIYNFQKELLCN